MIAVRRKIDVLDNIKTAIESDGKMITHFEITRDEWSTICKRMCWHEDYQKQYLGYELIIKEGEENV